MNKIKNFIKSRFNSKTFIYKLMKRIYYFLSTSKYKIFHYSKQKQENKKFTLRVNEACEIIEKYRNSEYIVFYNPTWLGVANSTKGLFENIVPLEQVFGNKNIKKIVSAVLQNNIKTVIFSQIVDGWVDILSLIKKANKDIHIKVIWHGNCYEFFSDYTWNLNKDIMSLYNDGKIDCFGFVRSTMANFYDKTGFKVCYLQNNVHFKNKEIVKKDKTNEIKVGIYNADSRELKNIYTAMSSIKLLENRSSRYSSNK